MFCEACGAQNNDGSKFCMSCGKKFESVAVQVQPQNAPAATPAPVQIASAPVQITPTPAQPAPVEAAPAPVEAAPAAPIEATAAAPVEETPAQTPVEAAPVQTSVSVDAPAQNNVNTNNNNSGFNPNNVSNNTYNPNNAGYNPNNAYSYPNNGYNPNGVYNPNGAYNPNNGFNPNNGAFSQPAQTSSSNGLAIGSIVVGAVGFFLNLILAFLGWACGIGGLVMSVIAKRKSNGDKTALIGMIVSGVTIFCSLINSLLGLFMLMDIL